MVTLNLLLTSGLAAGLAAVVSTAYLQLDPLRFVVEKLEAFSRNATILETHRQNQLGAVVRDIGILLRGHTDAVTSYLTAESGRGKHLRLCLADPDQC